MTSHQDRQVFVNCPFDDDYAEMFWALVFTIYKCNFVPRCTLEVDDAGENRFDKIVRIIRECGYGVHDISRTELGANGLPRFNMPLELGLFLGAQRFSSGSNRQKRCLVLDREPFRYQQFISDIAGQDIKAHHSSVSGLVSQVRDWLSIYNPGLESGSIMRQEYRDFQRDLPSLCDELRLVVEELTFVDYTRLVYVWLESRESSN
ncbi:MAG: hypothetical protein F4X65_13210 [Chloroflexi bacterium]|nr:hypothetical protein [Chloroflexota bacterium]